MGIESDATKFKESEIVWKWRIYLQVLAISIWNHDKPVDGKSAMFYQQTWQVSSPVLMDRVNSFINHSWIFSSIRVSCLPTNLASSTKDHRYIKNIHSMYQNVSKCIKILLQTQWLSIQTSHGGLLRLGMSSQNGSMAIPKPKKIAQRNATRRWSTSCFHSWANAKCWTRTTPSPPRMWDVPAAGRIKNAKWKNPINHLLSFQTNKCT
jgi:hypothetical protein